MTSLVIESLKQIADTQKIWLALVHRQVSSAFPCKPMKLRSAGGHDPIINNGIS